MSDISNISRYWSQGKRSDIPLDCPALTQLKIDGCLSFTVLQIPKDSSIEQKSYYETYCLIHKGYGTLKREDDVEETLKTGSIYFIEKEKIHKITNDSQTESLDVLVISLKKE